MRGMFRNIITPKVTEELSFKDKEFERLGLHLKKRIDRIFGRSLAIREVDTGSDNSPEIELVSLTTPYYDVGEVRRLVCRVSSSC